MIVARVRAGGDSGIAVGAGAVWSINRYPSSPEDISRIGAAGHGAVTRVPFLRGDGIAVHGDVAWAIAHTGTVAAIDARTGRVLRRYPQLAPSDAQANAENVLAVDDQGVWALSTENAQIVRIIGGRIERRIPVDRPLQPVIARARATAYGSRSAMRSAATTASSGSTPKPDESPPPSISARTAQPR